MAISDEEFEKLVQKVIDGEITRKEIEKEYHTSMRTINNRITKLADTNPKLYKEFINKFPYQEKERKDITPELILIKFASGKSFKEISKDCDVSVRTLGRRIKSNPEIYQLYQALKNKKMTPDKWIEIESIKKQQLIGTSPKNEKREEFLKRIIGEFDDKLKTGISKAEAARSIGKTYTDIDKLLHELNRIETEKEY